jgi:hypothetical protein
MESRACFKFPFNDTFIYVVVKLVLNKYMYVIELKIQWADVRFVYFWVC